jgi:hypothetical protein
MNELSAAVTEAADPDDFAALPVPRSCRAIALHKDETELFAGLDSRASRCPRSPSSSVTAGLRRWRAPPRFCRTTSSGPTGGIRAAHWTGRARLAARRQGRRALPVRGTGVRGRPRRRHPTRPDPTRHALAGGARPVCVVSDRVKAGLCRTMGADAVIDRSAESYRFGTWTGRKARAGGDSSAAEEPPST